MTSDELVELRRAIADYFRAERPFNWAAYRDARERLATLLSIPKREDGTFEFAKFETKKG